MGAEPSLLCFCSTCSDKKKKTLIGDFNITITHAHPALGHQPFTPHGQFLAINTLSLEKINVGHI